ncbi:MAG: 4Fe-4S dicluster domain-containing protein [Syntrophaceae bacterium]|nr:4Fe-4S dicluster domain-containing protein [Syntrophaceae bacterium]
MDNLQKIVHGLLQAGTIDGFLGYKEVNGHLLPFLFTRDRPEDLKGMVSRDPLPRYPLESFLVDIARTHPQARMGLLARECDARAVRELVKLNQLSSDRVFLIPLSCSLSNLHEGTTCSHPPSPAADGKKPEWPPRGIGKSATPEMLGELSPGERLRRWLEEFAKCIKCYGCRNVCPVYVCKECSLEDEGLIPVGRIPPDPSFHLVRAVHMAGFCIDCGLCEEACPAEIPLRTLYRGGNQIVQRLFGYSPGKEDSHSPFHKTGLSPTPGEAYGNE